MKELIKLLSQYGEVEENVSLKKLTTFKVGGTAMAVVYPRNNLAVKEVVEALQQAERMLLSLSFDRIHSLPCSSQSTSHLHSVP